MAVRGSLALASVLLVGFPAYGASLCQGGNCSGWIERFEQQCRASGGTPIHNPGGGGHCQPGPAGRTGGGMGGGAGGNPYMPMINDALQALWAWEAQHEAASKQRRAAIVQAIESERQGALARQQTEYAKSLHAIQQRLAGMGSGADEGGLKPKLGAAADGKPAEYGLPGRHVFRNDIFTGGNVDETEKIALTLRLGPDATASLRRTPGAAPAPAPAGTQEQQQKQARDEIAQILAKLSPQEQQKLAAILSMPGEGATAPTPAPVAPPSPAPSPVAASSPGPRLSPAFAEARRSADQLRADADDPRFTPEELKKRAEQQVTRPDAAIVPAPQPARAAQPAPAVSPAPVVESPKAERVAVAADATAASPAPRNTPASASAAGSTTALRSNFPPQGGPRAGATVQGDLQSGVPAPADARPGAPMRSDSTSGAPVRDEFRPGRIQAPEGSDLALLFRDRIPTPAQPASASQRATPAEIALAGAVGEWSDATSGKSDPAHHRRALLAHVAPRELVERYLSDPGLAAQVDRFIDQRSEEARHARAAADAAAWDAVQLSASRLVKRFTAAGQPFDHQALLANPDYVAARQRLIRAHEEAIEANARSAEGQLRRNLELGFPAFMY